MKHSCSYYLIAQTTDTKTYFIGARFHSNLKKWLWSDGSDANFSTNGLHSCQQKALHFGNKWEIINKNCTDEKASFVCETKCMYTFGLFAVSNDNMIRKTFIKLVSLVQG